MKFRSEGQRDYWQKKLAIQNGCCILCGEDLMLGDATKEHLYPKLVARVLIKAYQAKGKDGKSFASEMGKNIMAAHAKCNHTKGHQPPTKEQLERFERWHGEPHPFSERLKVLVYGAD